MLMVDRSYPPSREQVAAMHRNGVEALALYCGGANNGGRAWHPEHAALMRGEFQYILPIYVGQNSCPGCVSPVVLTRAQGAADGRDAVECAKAYGFNGGPLCLDVECDTYVGNVAGALAYMEAWTFAVQDGGYLPVLYAVIQTATDYLSQPGHPTGLWIANWDGKGDLSHFPHSERWAGIGWQYADNDGLGDDVSHVDGAWWTQASPVPATVPQPSGNPYYFKETDKYLDIPFQQFWSEGGGIAVFGLPVTGSRKESDTLVQNCEFAVFELEADGVKRRRLGSLAAAAAGFTGPGIP